MNAYPTPSETSFLQDPPRLGNQYEEDSALRAVLRRLLPGEVLREVEPGLERLGRRAVDELWPAGYALDRPGGRPSLERHHPFGRRVDRIRTAPEWDAMHAAAAEEGVVAVGYERAHGEHSRVHQMARLYLFAPSSGLYSCPMAMTDGAARLLELWLADDARGGGRRPNFVAPGSAAGVLGRAEAEDALARLVSRDPARMWTSGQWMTERGGGSDVAGGTETVAALDEAGGCYRLTGYKWFTSATTSQVAVTLARPEPARPEPARPGTGGLACFLVRMRGEDGALNGIRIARLKDKLGTKQLPTAELELLGARAHLLSPTGRGVPAIATMVNITRIHNAISACSNQRRCLALCRDYSHRRRVGGRPLAELGLHQATLASMEAKFRCCLYMTFEAVRLLGRAECAAEAGAAAAGGAEPPDETMLRILTPLVKLFTAKVAVESASEALECFGGQGYMEDTGLPALLRDSQVLPIWEGTTNVLSLDVVRVLGKHGRAAALFDRAARARADAAAAARPAALAGAADAVRLALGQLAAFLRPRGSASEHAEALTTRARDLALSMSRVFAASLALEHAAWSGEEGDAWVARRLASGELAGVCGGPLVAATLRRPLSDDAAAQRALALDSDPRTGAPRGCGNGPSRSSL